jgi:hypothetical protein
MQGSPTFNGCVPAGVAVLTGLRRLKLGISGLPRDTLSHLAPLAGLTSLRVDFSDPRRDVVLPSALAHLGALSGLTRLATLSVFDRTPPERLECVQPAAELLAALPSSPFLTEVRLWANEAYSPTAHSAHRTPGVPTQLRAGGLHCQLDCGRGLRTRPIWAACMANKNADAAWSPLLLPFMHGSMPPGRRCGSVPAPAPMCPQLDLEPVSIVGAPLDLSLVSRWPLLARLILINAGCIVTAGINSGGAEVIVGDMRAGPADTHGQLQGLLDGFIRPRWGRQPLPSNPPNPYGHVMSCHMVPKQGGPRKGGFGM